MSGQGAVVEAWPNDELPSDDEVVELEGDDLGAAIIARAKEHYNVDSVRRIEIPELSKDGKLFVIYAKPVTFGERDKAVRRSTRRGVLDDGELAMRICILKARDAKGNPVFDARHLNAMRDGVDSQVWARVAKEIMGDGFADEMDRATPDPAGN